MMNYDVSKLYFMPGALRYSKQSEFPYISILKLALEQLGYSPSGVTDGDKVDIVVSGGGLIWTIKNLAISRITGLQTILTSIQGNITNLQNAVVLLQLDVLTLQGQISILETLVNGVQLRTDLPATVFLNGTGAYSVPAGGGGGGTPGGSNTQVQFNDSGAFGGDSGLTYNKTTDKLTVANVIIGTVPTNDNALTQVLVRDAVTGDVKYRTAASLDAGIAWGAITGVLSSQLDLQAALNAKQVTLVSGTNIRTLNGTPLLGSGNITIPIGVAWGGITGTLSAQTDLQAALNAKQDDITLTTVGTSGFATFIGNVLNIPNYAGGGGTAPGGADGNIQYNNGGVFGAEADLNWDDVGKVLETANLKIVDTPTNNDALTQILARNSSTGDIEYRTAGSFGGGGGGGGSLSGTLFSGGGIATSAIIGIGTDGAAIYRQLSAGSADGVFIFSDGTNLWEIIDQKGPYIATRGGIFPGVDKTAELNVILNDSRVSEVVIDEGDITISGTLLCQGKTITFRNNGRLVGAGTIDGININAGLRQNIFATTLTFTNATANGEFVSCKWFGATGNGVTNDQPALQKSSDTIIANDKLPRSVRVFGGEDYRLESPWILYKWDGSNYAFFTCNIIGEETAWFAGYQSLALFTCTNTNTFAIAYQLARSSTVQSIAIRGQFSPPFDYYNMESYTRPFATWASAYGMRDSFNSPYSGFVIDPFINANVLPSDGGYPGLSSWYRGTGSHTGSGSSGLRMKDCRVAGFTVDIMCSPNGGTQNCEDIHLENVCLEVAKVAYASGQDQIKNNTINRAATWDRVHTLVDTRSYGFGTGLMPNIDGWNIASGSIIRIHNVDGLRFPCSVRNIFSELLFSIGNGNGGIGFHYYDCEFGFNTYGPYWVPQAHVTDGNIAFHNCVFRYYNDAFDVPIIAFGEGFQFDSCLLNMAPVLNNPYQSTLTRSATFKNCKSGHGMIGWDTGESTAPMAFPLVAYGHVEMRRTMYNWSDTTYPNGGYTRRPGAMNYIFNCGTYVGYRLINCCMNMSINSATRIMTITGVTADRMAFISVGDYIIDEDTSYYWGIVSAIDVGGETVTVKNVPVDATGSIVGWSFGVQYVRRVAGHFIGDLTVASDQITNCEFDPFFTPPYVGQRLYLGHADGEETIVRAVSGSTIYLSRAAAFTALNKYFTPIDRNFATMDSYFGTFYDPSLYAEDYIGTNYPLMIARGARVYPKTQNTDYDSYPVGDDWICNTPGWMYPAGAGKTHQAEFQPYNYAKYYIKGSSADFTQVIPRNRMMSVITLHIGIAGNYKVGLTLGGDELITEQPLDPGKWDFSINRSTERLTPTTIYIGGVTAAATTTTMEIFLL